MNRILRRRRALMTAPAGPTARIPAEYQEVTYIRSSTSGYLETGIVPKTAPKLETTVRNAESTNKRRTIFYLSTSPTTETSSPVAFRLQNYAGSASNLSFQYGTASATSHSADALKPAPSGWVTLSVSNKLVVNGTTVTTKTAADFSGNTAQIVLSTSSVQTGTYQFKDVVIWDGTAKVAEMVPCYRKSDSKIGMYCLVRKAFYPGTGTYSKGADVTT